jgi:hypothetical protein
MKHLHKRSILSFFEKVFSFSKGPRFVNKDINIDLDQPSLKAKREKANLRLSGMQRKVNHQ